MPEESAPIDILLACAASAIKFWPDFEQASTMVAIGGPESGQREVASGDPWWIFPFWEQAAYRAASCNGYTAFGWLQINLRWNTPHVARFSGTNEPCANAAYLQQYDNASRVGRVVFDNQGYRAWSAYNSGLYRDWLFFARLAVAQLMPGQQTNPFPWPGVPPQRAYAPPARALAPPAAAKTPLGL